jgi:hypothetical protein
MTRDDGLDDPRRQERQPRQTPNVVREHPFTPGERGNRFHLAAQQIVSPLASPRDGFDECEISQWSWRATALENQTHLETVPPDLHRKDTRDNQARWRGAVNALSRMHLDKAELSFTQTFRFEAGAAAWANQVHEHWQEITRRICCASNDVSIKDKSVAVEGLLARTNAGTLDEAIRGLERKRRLHVMGGAGPFIRLIRGAWDLYQGKPASAELELGRIKGGGPRTKRRRSR